MCSSAFLNQKLVKIQKSEIYNFQAFFGFMIQKLVKEQKAKIYNYQLCKFEISKDTK